MYRFLLRWGLDLRTFETALRASRRYHRDYRRFRKQWYVSTESKSFPLGENWPVFGEDADAGGVASGAYFHQDLFVARQIFDRRPSRHIDVGSRVDGFVAHVATYRSIDVIDIRPISSTAEGINFIHGDLMKLGPEWVGVADSVSCLHALEHLGLGRYGDSLEPDGWRLGLAALTNILSPLGILYLSVPASNRQRVEFNAHRIFSVPFLADVLSQTYDVEELAFVDDRGDLHRRVSLESSAARTSFDSELGCSIWVLRKKADFA